MVQTLLRHRLYCEVVVVTKAYGLIGWQVPSKPVAVKTAGLGVYFASARHTAIGYAARYGGTPVMIVCRVSLGKILNIDLAPTRVEANVGGSGIHSELNRYAERYGYTSSEWWNGSYWEYCMFDWQSKYNEPWRIRPIYVLNLRTGLAQHIDGGFRH